jgi:hypothetical protein
VLRRKISNMFIDTSAIGRYNSILVYFTN